MQILFRAHELARRLGVSVRSLERWRAEGTGPAYTRAGGIILYSEADVTEWLARNRRPTAGAPARAAANP